MWESYYFIPSFNGPTGDDIAVSEGYFRPTKPHQGSATFIGSFSPGWTRHVDFHGGARD
jgi:hypothetical protein